MKLHSYEPDMPDFTSHHTTKIIDNSQLFEDPTTSQVAMAMQRRQMLTRATEERLRAENRKWEYQREDHMRMVAQDRLLRANMASDERVEKKRCVYMYVYMYVCVCTCNVRCMHGE